MLCPFKFGRYKFEGGEECHKDCAWNVGGGCAVTAIAAGISQVKKEKVDYGKDDDRR